VKTVLAHLTHLALTLLAIGALLACSREGPTPQPERGGNPPDAPAEVQAHACDPMPAARPAGLSLAVVRHVLPHGDLPRRERAELVADLSHCSDPAHCRLASDATLDALWALGRGRLPEAVPWTPTRRSPHFGARFVQVRWEGGECEVGESSSVELSPEGAVALRAAIEAVVRAWSESPETPR